MWLPRGVGEGKEEESEIGMCKLSYPEWVNFVIVQSLSRV